jgi:hypothetical protein
MSDLTRENRAHLAALIERVLAEELSASEAIVAANHLRGSATRDRIFDDAWHALVHYDLDADIRSRVASYADHQQEGLVRWVERLRQPGSG